MNRKKPTREQQISELEKQNKFDVDYLPQCKRFITPDGNFVFVKKNFFYKISCAICRTITFVFGPLVCLFVGFTKIRGKENLKALKNRGAICICNHIGYLDTLYIKQTIGHYRSYHTGAPWNNMKGFGGFLLRRAGFLSLGGTIGAQRNFKTTVGELLEKGAIINYYPEHALWQKYEKPRPMKSGAFKTAASFSVPVLPMFVTFEGKHKRPVMNVLPLVYPDETLPPRLMAQKMQDECAELWKQTYEKIYGKQLSFETEINANVIVENAESENSKIADTKVATTESAKTDAKQTIKLIVIDDENKIDFTPKHEEPKLGEDLLSDNDLAPLTT